MDFNWKCDLQSSLNTSSSNLSISGSSTALSSDYTKPRLSLCNLYNAKNCFVYTEIKYFRNFVQLFFYVSFNVVHLTQILLPSRLFHFLCSQTFFPLTLIYHTAMKSRAVARHCVFVGERCRQSCEVFFVIERQTLWVYLLFVSDVLRPFWTFYRCYTMMTWIENNIGFISTRFTL